MTRFGKNVSRTLSVLLLLTIILAILTAVAVTIVAMFFGSLPDGAIALLPLGGQADLVTAAFGTAAGRIVLAVGMLEGTIVTIVVALMLRRILGSAVHGQPFVRENVHRLRVIAGAYAVSLATSFLLPLVTPAAVLTWQVSHGSAYDIDDLGPLMVALVLAEVFREGIRLREDSDMTV